MNKFIKLAGVAALASAALAGSANAEDRAFEWSITVGGTSDYVFRGLSLNNEEPAAQGSVDMSYGIFYAGAWASNVGVKGDGAYAPMELDLYTGIKPTLGQFTFDFGLIGYLYPIADDPGNYLELKAGVSTEIFKSLTGGVTFYYTPDQNNYPKTWTVEGTLAYELPQMHIFTPTLSGTLGYSDDPDNAGAFSMYTDNYTYWNVGLALAVEKFTFDFRYWDTNLDQTPSDFYTGLSDSRFVFSVKATLP
ncbi:MAG: TorF family putative porin [Hyphomicrobiaceae bacterium]|nr:TorF family putative porin [Hyphomicrobiaceae bacterium]